jgi:hypothetical protein
MDFVMTFYPLVRFDVGWMIKKIYSEHIREFQKDIVNYLNISEDTVVDG